MIEVNALEFKSDGAHISISDACIGPIIGLVAITPPCGLVQPGWATLVAILATVIVYVLLLLKKVFHARPIQLWYQIAGIHTDNAGILLPLHWTIGIRLAKVEK
ncbi:hypothetical protein I4U23_030892 [Adineta vaga]|nr:hypothetical protein I4U23_030892 [Adineta vaga]